MKTGFVGTLALLVAAGAAVGVPAMASRAQDSVAAAAGLPGDAVDPYSVGAAGEQVNNYVVDLVPRRSSWGGKYVVGPVLKASRSSTSLYFDYLIGASAASQRFVPSPLLRSSYDVWSAAGAGVSGSSNTAPGSVSTAGKSGYRFAAAFMEFGSGPDALFGSAEDENSVVVGVIDFLPSQPNRLYVSRIAALANKQGPTTGNTATASMGLGSVDADGRVHVLVDGWSATSPQRVQNRRYVRVNAAGRSPAAVNWMQQSAQGDGAANTIVRDTTTPLTTPSMIPAAVGGRPVVIGTDFTNNLHAELTPNSTTTTKAYLPGATGSPRGGVSVLARPFAPLVSGGQGGAAVGATLVRTNSDTRTRAIQFFGLSADGAVGGQSQVALPTDASAYVDRADGFSPGTALAPMIEHEFTGYQSQASFRGGNGQVAMTTLGDGDLLAAALVGVGSGSAVPASEENAIAVVRLDAGGGAPVWSIAAHTGTASGAAGGLSKAIYGDFGADGVPGTADAGEGDNAVDMGAPIGRLARASEVAGLFTGSGPSISAPAMDRAGNVYFIANVELNAEGGGVEHTRALVRANRSAAAGGGEAFALEIVLKSGDVTLGANSAKPYQVQFLGIADGDSIDSGSLWSGSVVHDSLPWGGMIGSGGAAAAAPYGSPMSLGALLLRAKVVYDVDGDGQFADPSGGGNEPDQAYNVLLAVMPEAKGADFNRDGVVSVQDIYDFLFAWSGVGLDYNGENGSTVQDIYDFLSAWNAG